MFTPIGVWYGSVRLMRKRSGTGQENTGDDMLLTGCRIAAAPEWNAGTAHSRNDSCRQR